MIIHLQTPITEDAPVKTASKAEKSTSISYKDKVIQDRLVMLFLFVATFVAAILYSEFFGV
ncbi:hypothetical protein GS399_16975 [Pedobacter sp. HMF7647]|uniref:Uncharacterized protein n=1 Tax=Hufsiella arboris TaxID=2695275 RepID=A0A7K1YE37_9SPHI|nr:hypothetical protein [Hufsiella arboris]MXV52670.1 hypothetical protein [Hufsiella arboris]